MTEQELLLYLSEVQKKSDKLMSDPKFEFEHKSLITDLFKIIAGFRSVLADQNAGSADQRVLKKKMDALKQEIKSLEDKLEQTQSKLIALVNDCELISKEANLIAARHSQPQDPDNASTIRLNSAVRTMMTNVMTLMKIAKKS